MDIWWVSEDEKEERHLGTLGQECRISRLHLAKPRHEKTKWQRLRVIRKCDWTRNNSARKDTRKDKETRRDISG